MNYSLLLITLFATATLHADVPPELAKLNESYANAVEKVTAPVRQTYQDELTKLQERYTKAGNLDAALEVRRILEQFSGAPTSPSANQATATPVPAAPGNAPPPALPQGLSKSSEKKAQKLVERFAGKTWINDQVEYTLNVDGTAIRVLAGVERRGYWKFEEAADSIFVRTGDDYRLTFPSETRAEAHPAGAAAAKKMPKYTLQLKSP